MGEKRFTLAVPSDRARELKICEVVEGRLVDDSSFLQVRELGIVESKLFQ